jgi:hypothetical protein
MTSALLLCGERVSAQRQPPQDNSPHAISNQDLDLLRMDIRSKKKAADRRKPKTDGRRTHQVLAVNDEHTAELVKINDEKFALIQEYADHWGE